ncbi:MAG: ParB/RepB/Spo0J family partition protein [Oscillospiraceae bacterium]|nr:ParB/RepB/Spo0J family partition protein [Oscillospiraceae bacterium]
MAKEKKGLGTGLDALFSNYGMDDAAESELQTVSVTKIEPRLEQPRNYFDEEALQTLSESIAQHGLIQPITVRKVENGFYQIIAGERRWRASRMAGLKEVPVRIIEADDKKVTELALVENLQREDLNPIEEAKGYKSLIEEYGMTQDEASRSVGKSRPAVTNSLRLLSLSQPVMDYVEHGELSAGHARALLGISDPEKQKALADEIIEKSYSVRKAESMVSAALKEKTEAEENDGKISVDYAAEVSENLSRLLSRKVKLVDGRKTGHIVIEYYGSDDREALIQAIQKLK